MRFEMPERGVLKPNDVDDPLPFYYHPLVGWMYRRRLQLGLDLLPESGTRVLEVGVGSGVLVPTLTKRYAEYTGTDLTLAPGLERLVAPGCRAEFRCADLLAEADLPESHYDAIVCFSVLEHVADSDAAAQSLARALAPGGTLVAGYPMVNRAIGTAFALIGFRHIEIHHVSPPWQIAAALARVLTPGNRKSLPPNAPVSAALYQCSSWTKPL